MVERAERVPTHRAIRLLVSYDRGRLAIRERLAVEAATPPSDPIRGFEGQSGFWLELRDARGTLLFRRVMHNPIPYEVESHDLEAGPRRHRVARPAGVFSVLLPDLPGAESLVIVSSPLDPDKSAAPAEPLARLPLGQRKRKG